MKLLPAFVGTPEPGNVYHMDALELLKALPDASVSLIATDPPYNGVKDDAWDNQWQTDRDFLDWLRVHLVEMRRVLKPNGSLYLFASPQMAARVEVLIGEYFNVLNQVVWAKPFSRHNQSDKEILRGFFPQTERVIFAEQFGSDAIASGDAGWVDAELALKKTLFGDEIARAMRETNTSTHELVEALKAYRDHNHGGAASNWIAGYNIPTPEQYQKMRDYLNSKANGGDYLRREYEDLRRPFNSSPYAPYTDVWTFRTVQAYPGKHPTEKPLELMRHIVKMSSRPGDLVLDPFAGSGTTLDAASQEGRGFIGCDITLEYVDLARKRLSMPYTLNMFETVAVAGD